MDDAASVANQDRVADSVRGPPVTCSALSMRFGDVDALAEISLEVHPGEILAVIGPSGCGKSTLLRIVGGLIEPTDGRIAVGGKSPAEMRAEHGYGFLFQTPIMFSWLTLLDNVGLAGRLVGIDKRERHRRARDWLDRVGLTGFEGHRPHQLSGGMRQRAALARALTLSPSLLLMDEPFGALDEITRRRMTFEVLGFLADQQATVLLVTHSIEEAVLMADRIAVISARPGTVREIIDSPLPWPRTRETQDAQEFLDMRRRVRVLIEEEEEE